MADIVITSGTHQKIKDGIALMNPNDQLLCRGGIYTGIRADNSAANDTFHNLPNGSGGGYTTVKAYENEPVTFHSQAGTSSMIGLRNGTTRWAFEGIEWVGLGVGGPTYQTFIKRLSATNFGSFIKVTHCHIRDFRASAFLIGGYTDNIFTDNLIHDIGHSGQEHGFYLNNAAHRNEVARTTCYNMSGFCIHHYSSSGDSNTGRYHDNHFYQFGKGTTGGAGSGILIANGADNWAWNNVIHHGNPGTSGAGIELNWTHASTTAPTNARIFHNAIYKTRLAGIILARGSGHIAQNNIILECGGTIQDTVSSSKVTNLDSGTGTAVWVDPETLYDFHLLAGASGAIDQGTFHASFLTDRNGNTRPDPTCDIGPYEFGGAIQPPDVVVPPDLVTQVNVTIGFDEFGIIHSGDLVEGIVYMRDGSLA